MKVFVVYGDDHDYDAMSQWLVGVYTTLELAEEAAQKDKERYWKENNITKKKDRLYGPPNIGIYETELDTIYKPELDVPV